MNNRNAWLEEVNEFLNAMEKAKAKAREQAKHGFVRDFIDDVIFNPPATIVLWSDGTKTVVRTQNKEEFDAEKGLAMAIVKKIDGNKGNYNEIFRDWVYPVED